MDQRELSALYRANPEIAEFELRHGPTKEMWRNNPYFLSGFEGGYEGQHQLSRYFRILNLSKDERVGYNQGFKEGEEARKKHKDLLWILFGIFGNEPSRLPDEIVQAIEHNTQLDKNKLKGRSE